jgi:hypothetical protein
MLKEVANRAKVTTNIAMAALPIASIFSSVIKLSGLYKGDLNNKAKIRSLLAEEIKKIVAVEEQKIMKKISKTVTLTFALILLLSITATLTILPGQTLWLFPVKQRGHILFLKRL